MKKVPLTDLQKQAISEFEDVGNAFLYANDSKAANARFERALEAYVRKYVTDGALASAA